MNIPAYAAPTLCIGRTYDARNVSAGIDIFPSNIPVKKINVNHFTFKYKVVRNSNDVKDLLDISGELSLKVKAGLVKVEGSGKYLTDTDRKEKTTELLTVLKCVTVNETMDGSVKVDDDVASGQLNHSLGTHFVRGVTYGAEMVASLSIKSSSSSETAEVQGKAEGEISVHVASVGLKTELKKLTSKCKDTADISVKYYATDLPDKLPTTLDGLVELIESFPSRLKDINDGKGIPLQFELLPISAAPGIQTAEFPCQHALNPLDEELMEQYFDDLQNAHYLVKKYEESSGDDDDDDVLEFIEEINTVRYHLRDAISKMNSTDGKEKVDAGIAAYRKALGGRNISGKFCRRWTTILKTKTESSKLVPPATIIKLPEGKPLTIVLLGKTGNGKSSTGNSIVGQRVFEENDVAQSVTVECKCEIRLEEREIKVIDTPGVIDTSVVKKMSVGRGWFALYAEDQKRVLKEVARIFLLAPDGFDAISLVLKYGCRFTPEDGQALQLLQSFLGKEAETHMFVILSNADQAKRRAKINNISLDDCVKEWVASLPKWVNDFIERIGQSNVLYFDNTLDQSENPDDCKKQVSNFIQAVDVSVQKHGGPFTHELTKQSNEELEERIKKALRESGLEQKKGDLLEQIRATQVELQCTQDEQTREFLQSRLIELHEILIATRREEFYFRTGLLFQPGFFGTVSGRLIESMMSRHSGCFPGSAMFIDKHGRQRNLSSMHIDDEVQVITNNEIRFEPVITFIHRQPEGTQEFLQITTERNNILKITEDHLLFVEKTGKAIAIPARDVKIRDTLYVRAGHSLEKDAVLNISKVYEEGVYAPVTLSGTILVNNVHTSCYFDVLSHEWSHRAMGVARAVHYVSPWILQWISSVGQKDGFPGWCRLAHKILTLSN